MKMDPLQEALRAKEKHFYYNIPPKYEHMFKSKSYDLEYFGLTFAQRAIAFSVCLILAILCFMYSMIKIVTAVINPGAFVLPYALSNFLLFTIPGFLLGFKSYFSNLFSEKKRSYTTSFVVCTFVTLYTALRYKNYFVSLVLAVLQVVVFVIFALTFIPGGTNGVGSMFNLFLRQ